MMKTKKQEQRVKHRIAPRVTENQELHKYEESFKRWLAQEIINERMTIAQAAKELDLPHNFVWKVVKTFTGQVEISLPAMTEAEKKKLEKQQQRIKELEKQLETAQIKNITLETLIDVAEKELKIPIRKKPGAKQ
jgi:transposase-like protein